jgi:hypothetical protein
MGPVMTGGDALTGKTMIMITLRANRTGRNILGSQANYPPSTQLGWPKTFVLSNIQPQILPFVSISITSSIV